MTADKLSILDLSADTLITTAIQSAPCPFLFAQFINYDFYLIYNFTPRKRGFQIFPLSLLDFMLKGRKAMYEVHYFY